MTRSYKMVVIKYMLSRGSDKWLDPVTPQQVAPFFHHYLAEKDYRAQELFSGKQGEGLQVYNERIVASLISRMPMTYWSNSSKGLITFEDNQFVIHLEPLPEHEETLYNWMVEICDYRLHAHFERKYLAAGD